MEKLEKMTGTVLKPQKRGPKKKIVEKSAISDSKRGPSRSTDEAGS
jgi:hypothetical protein